MRIVSRDRWFETRHFYNGISLIHEPYVRPFYRCNMWHVQGRERDVLVDSGSGLVSLREQLPWLTERPLLAVASHTHFDHIAGHHEFAERLAHPAEAEILAAPDSDNTLARAYVGDEMFEAHPECPLCYAEYRVRAAPATRLVDEGDVLDLGDRVLQVLHTPGHSPGGISLWEAATQTLFSGDIVYDGPLIEDAYHSNLDDYAASLARLRELPVRTVHGGHFASFSGGALAGNDRRLVQEPRSIGQNRDSGQRRRRRRRPERRGNRLSDVAARRGAGVARRFPPGWVACAGARSGQGRHRVATPGFAARVS